MQDWKPYQHEQPRSVGVYRWRVPHKTIEGLSVIFDALMRTRGNGHQPDINSPACDSWDGYTVTVPRGTEWRPCPGDVECKSYDRANLRVDGLDFMPCPFCGNVPSLDGAMRSSGGGIVICAEPFEYNSWWLKCCDWGRTPHLADPRALEAARRKAFGMEMSNA